MRFKTDENLPEEFADVLRAAGWDALSVVQQQLGGKVDPEIADICRDESRVLVTLDVGFGDIRSYPPDEYAGVIVLRPGRQDKPSVLAVPVDWSWRYGSIPSITNVKDSFRKPQGARCVRQEERTALEDTCRRAKVRLSERV